MNVILGLFSVSFTLFKRNFHNKVRRFKNLARIQKKFKLNKNKIMIYLNIWTTQLFAIHSVLWIIVAAGHSLNNVATIDELNKLRDKTNVLVLGLFKVMIGLCEYMQFCLFLKSIIVHDPFRI